jgi:hypothetical protein
MKRTFLWDKAESDLGGIDPGLVARLKHSAEQILHDIPPWRHDPDYDEGVSEDGIMWHRAKVPCAPEERLDGCEKYFVFYRNGADQAYEILGVRSVHQVANRAAAWMRDSFL